MKHNIFLLTQLLAAGAPVWAQSQDQTNATQSDPYVPVYVDCPRNLTVRNASDGLSEQERAWREARSQQVITSLTAYLNLANITDFDIQNFTQQLNSSNVPITGLSISGGGSQSGLGGLGIWQAYDSRYPEAVAARTGGLTQLWYYITGLSGGGAITVSELATNNLSTVEAVRESVNYSRPYDVGPSGNQTQFFEQAFETVGGKAEAGFPVSVADTFGRFWANWLPQNSSFANYSDFAENSTTNRTAFAVGAAPMPIIVLAEVVPGESPEIGNITYPGRNETNGFNLTSYEVNPFEFGSWLGGRVQAFFPTEYLGTAMNNGSAQNDSQCVEGFDKLSLIQGTTTDAFVAYFIDYFYDIPIFAKRSLQTLHSRSSHHKRQHHKRQMMPNITAGTIPVPQNETNSPLVQLVNETATTFDISFNQSLYGTYPNPFENYNEEMANVTDLLLVDGSLTGETNPIRPLIIPERELDFIIVYEASSDAKYNWVNGTNLINTANSAKDGNLSFPDVPDVNTFIQQNLTKQPTFFGCNSTDTPLVLYLPNSPWTSYTNFSFQMSSFTDNQVDLTFNNSFQLATYGNGTVDPEWPACLACATIRGSMLRLGLDMPEQCTRCYDRHCWSGTSSTQNATMADMDPTPRLNSSLTYTEWYDTIWTTGEQNMTTVDSQREEEEINTGDPDDQEDESQTSHSPSTIALFATVFAFFLVN